MLAGRALRKVSAELPEIEIEEVDIVLQPLRAWQEGIRMIPSLKRGTEILSGVLLSEEQIRGFLQAKQQP